MSGTDQTRENYTLGLNTDDQATPKLDKLKDTLDGVTKSAAGAAAAVTGAGVAAEGAATKVTAASAAWDRVARRNDDVTAAAYRLKSAQEELTRVTALANKAMADGGADQDQTARVLQRLADNVDRLKASLIATREAQEGAAQAQKLWQAGLESGDELLTGLATSAAATSAAFVKGSAEAAVYGQSLDSLRARFDSTFAASKAYEGELALLTRAFELGAIKGPLAQAKALDELNAKYGQTTGTAKALAAQQEAAAAAAQKQADAWKILGDSIANLTAKNEANRASYDSVFRVSKEYEAQLNKMTADLNANRISQEQFNVFLDKANATMANAGRTVAAYAAGHGQAAFATRQLGVQTVQFFSSLESGIPFMTALVEQGHQLVDVALATGTGFGVVGQAVKAAFAALISTTGLVVTGVTAVVGAVVLMGYSAESSQRQLLGLQNTLRATRDDYLGLANVVNQASRNVASSSGLSVSEARTAGATIAGAPRFEGTQRELEDLIRLSGDLAVTWGVKVPDAAKVLADAMEDPAKVADDLAKKHFPGMTAELARLIERMANSGDAAGAYNAVIKVLKDQNDHASDSLTHLQQALRDTANLFTSSKTSGSSWGDVINQTVADVIDHFNTLIRKIQETRQAAKDAQAATPQGPSPAAVDIGIAEPFDSTVGQLPSVAARVANIPTAASAQQPDTRLPGLTDAMKNLALDAAKAVDTFNAAMDKAVNLVKASPFGKLQDASDAVTGLTTALDTLGPRTVENAKRFDELSLSLQISQKALDDAQIAANNYFKTATDKSVEATEAQAQGQRDIAAAYADGNDAVIQATAYAKAYEAALSQEIPGTDRFTAAVIRMTVANVDNARSVGAVKAAEDSRNIDDQIELINAETTAILNNTAANRANVQAIKDKQAVDKLGEAGASPDAQAHALAQRISLDAATADKQLATSAASLADKYKPAEVAQLNEKIGEFRDKLKELGPRTEENAAVVDKYANAIKGAEAEITRLNKTHEVHRAELDKQQDKLGAQIDAQNKLTKAYGEGGEAVLLITAQMKAQEQAISDNLKPGTEKFAAAVKQLTQEQLAYARAQAETKAVQESNDLAQDIKVVQAETTSLLDNSDARALMIQHMKDEYEIRKNNVGLTESEKQGLIAQKDALAQLTQVLANRQQTLSYLSQQFSSAFDAIGNAVTQAFVQGEGAAVKWGNVLHGVLTQVLQMFAHLAILNPIMNSLFGQNNPTLSSVFGLLGGGSSTSSASGLVGSALRLVDLGGGQQGLQLVGGAAGGVGGISSLIGTQEVGAGPGIGGVFGGGTIGGLAGLYAMGAGQGGGGTAGSSPGFLSNLSSLFQLGSGANTLSGGSLVNSLGLKGLFSGGEGNVGLFDTGGFFGSGGTVANFLSTPVIGSVSASATDTALAGLGTGVYGPATEAAYSAAGGAVPITVGGLTSIAGGVIGGYGIGSTVGGFEQRALGKVGPAPQIGAALGAVAGAGIGFVVGGPGGALIGGLLGGTLGGAGGGLIGPKAPSPFSSTMITVGPDGLLSVGGTASQLVDTSGERSGAISDAASINQILQARGLRVTSLEGANTGAPYLQIGQNTPGGFQDPSKYSSLGAAFPSLRFQSNDPLTQQFIQNRLFQSPEELQGVTTSLADFETALKGTKAESDTMGIALRALANAANTDVQPALQKAATFITATFPTLTAGNPGSLATAQSQVYAQYSDALAVSRQIGFGTDELLAAQQRAYDKNNKAAQDALDASAASVQSRFLTAQATVTGSPQDAMNAQLVAFDSNAKQTRQQLSDTLTGIWGDAYATTADYAQRMADNDKATAEERLAIQVQFNKQQVQLIEASNEQLLTLQARAATAAAALTGDPTRMQAAQVGALNAQQAIERNQYIQSEQQTYGDLFGTADPNNLAKWLALLSSQNDEMALLNQQIARANLQLKVASDQQDQTIALRFGNAQAALNPSLAPSAALSSFDVQASQERQNLYLSLTATYGNAYAATQEYADKLNALVKTQGEERLVLEQTLHDRQMQQAAASQQQDASFATRYENAAAQVSGSVADQKKAALDALDEQQREERTSLYMNLTATYGAAYALTQDYANKLTALQKAQGEERLALQKQQDDALKSQASASIASLNQYAISLQTSDKSPLSPQAQLALAQRQFDTQANLAASGNYGAVQTLQQYSDAYLSAAHNVYGSGIDYVQAFGKVITALATVGAQSPDLLTASVLQTETRTQTAILVEQLQDLQDEVKQLRVQLAQGTSAPARVS